MVASLLGRGPLGASGSFQPAAPLASASRQLGDSLSTMHRAAFSRREHGFLCRCVRVYARLIGQR